MRTTYVMRDGELVLKAEAGPLNASAYVISDTMDATRNMADGRLYDSKSQYTRAVHAAGCEIIGNDRSVPKREFMPSVTGHDIQRSIEQLRGR